MLDKSKILERMIATVPMPVALQTDEFQKLWGKYLERRLRVFDEIVTEESYRAMLAFLADEPDALAVVAYAMTGSKRSIRPIDLEGHKLYKTIKAKYRYAVRAHRTQRGEHLDKVSDTVFVPRSEAMRYAVFGVPRQTKAKK